MLIHLRAMPLQFSAFPVEDFVDALIKANPKYMEPLFANECMYQGNLFDLHALYLRWWLYDTYVIVCCRPVSGVVTPAPAAAVITANCAAVHRLHQRAPVFAA